MRLYLTPSNTSKSKRSSKITLCRGCFSESFLKSFHEVILKVVTKYFPKKKQL